MTTRWCAHGRCARTRRLRATRARAVWTTQPTSAANLGTDRVKVHKHREIYRRNRLQNGVSRNFGACILSLGNKRVNPCRPVRPLNVKKEGAKMRLRPGLKTLFGICCLIFPICLGQSPIPQRTRTLINDDWRFTKGDRKIGWSGGRPNNSHSKIERSFETYGCRMQNPASCILHPKWRQPAWSCPMAPRPDGNSEIGVGVRHAVGLIRSSESATSNHKPNSGFCQQTHHG